MKTFCPTTQFKNEIVKAGLVINNKFVPSQNSSTLDIHNPYSAKFSTGPTHFYNILRSSHSSNAKTLNNNPGRICFMYHAVLASGFWAIDVADAHPDAAVIGRTYQRPIHPDYVFPNRRLEIADADEEWMFP
ncbi:uncharacterized protein A1O5_11704 [Cladophialophora psammophila CBS 110553]|uniref:Uncharacterized protein n=1 Tax=Cladophialophora psammophila CBS 110553 TaxID=1182543 RepID=W9W8T3_9EURO|nr:uncharacterized protein A1O5_11704 [Cladophialophora psammophila CBS 110553]EXJ61390.1 hypothetical protein A1O5_11704 [Cladophialophora psammophila CBS 110553]